MLMHLTSLLNCLKLHFVVESSQLKKQITIRLDEESINYFKSISEGIGIPYQSLINLYPRDCAASHRKLNLKWK